jgi:hypothetical protein
MIDPVILLATVVVIVALFGFVGCGTTLTLEPEETPPDQPGKPVDPADKVKDPVASYTSIISGTAGVVAHWPLNEVTGNVAVEIRNGKNGFYKPGPTQGITLGQPGAPLPQSQLSPTPRGVLLDGVQGYVEVPFDPTLNTAQNTIWTVEVWVKPSAGGSDTQVIISSHEIDATRNRGYEIALVRAAGQTQQQVRARVFSNTGPTPGAPAEILVSPTQGAPTDWRHIVFTYNGTSNALTLYVNVLIASAGGGFTRAKFTLPPAKGEYQPTTGPQASTLRFGAGHQKTPAPVSFFAGVLDEVAFYNAALSTSDIDTHFNAAS